MDILEKIVTQKRKRIQEKEEFLPYKKLTELWEKKAAASSPTLKKPILSPKPFHVIAEIKRASPSKGQIPWALPLEEIIRNYETGGASLISVLTEEDFFSGGPVDLQRIRTLTSLPILRKDFLFTEYQIYESALWDTDFILLIAAILDDSTLQSLLHLAEALGLRVLVECRDEAEIFRALNVGANFIGINNRDLRTFEINLKRTEELALLIPDDCLLVSESGILAPQDAAYVSRCGADAVLVGESCVRSSHPAGHIQALLEAGLKEKGGYQCSG
jgi:indole-3-glycerol phosphate synthase